MLTLTEMIRYAAQVGASDLHVSVGMRPRVRLDAQLVDSAFDVVTRDAMDAYVAEIVPKTLLKRFLEERELDFSFGHAETGRIRVNAYLQRSTPALAIRILPDRVRKLNEIGLPSELMTSLAAAQTGLLLVTGPTGTGKTTTLAAIIDYIAASRAVHIVTIEDPIEYVFRHTQATIHQREVGRDTWSFAKALKYVLRQDPDVVVIGELRDLETVEAALTAAETGHLVVATLHTPDAVQTLNRIVDVFPDHKHSQVRTQLSFVLNAIVSQRLLPAADGKGRVLAAEILVATPAVRSMIRESKTHQIYSTIQTGSKDGMRGMNQSLGELVGSRKVSLRHALSHVTNADEFRRAAGIQDSRSLDETLQPARPGRS
jgi:twitching motility protein PilT